MGLDAKPLPTEFSMLKSSSTKISRKSKLYDTSFENFNMQSADLYMQSFVKVT